MREGRAMRDDLVLDLADCTEFRQALQARPPGIVHGTLALLVALIGTALGWSAATRATLVVQGSGRIRPVTTPVQVSSAARGESLSASVGGRIVEVNRSEEHTSELQSLRHLVCRLLL